VAAGVSANPGVPWGKAVFAGLLLLLLLPVSALWAMAAAAAVGFALWRWRRLGWGLFFLLMVGVMLAVPLLAALTSG
jgi:hypothetical protein